MKAKIKKGDVLDLSGLRHVAAPREHPPTDPRAFLSSFWLFTGKGRRNGCKYTDYGKHVTKYTSRSGTYKTCSSAAVLRRNN